MKRIIFLSILFNFIISCNDYKNESYKLLNDFTSLNFNSKNSKIVDNEKYTSGLKEEGMKINIFDISNLNMDSLAMVLSQKQYMKLPMKDIKFVSNFGFKDEVTDTGYYLIKLQHESIVEEFAEFNLTKKRIVYYKLL
jgi:hypothetical protein